MPIYEYRCQECGREFDELRRSSNAADAICPACGGSRTTRLISLIAGISGTSNGGGGRAAGGGSCACGGACACGR